MKTSRWLLKLDDTLMQFPIIYLHIPKTAGTSFRMSAEQYFGPDQVLNDYGEESPSTSEDIRSSMYGNDPAKLRKTGLEKKFLSGHFCMAKYKEIFPNSPVVTFFREPVARVVSEYVHFSSHYDFEGSLSDFYKKPHFQNRQSRSMSGALPTDLDFYGITEDYQLGLEKFNLQYGTNFPMAKLNTGKYKGVASSIASAKEIAEITELNQEDIELYQYAVEHFEDQNTIESRPLKTLKRYCGSIGGLNKRGIVGWTVDRESNAPAGILITVNGEERCRLVADQYREDVQRKGLHVDGHCGFSLARDELGRLAPGDRISIRTSDGGFELTNSPVIVPD